MIGVRQVLFVGAICFQILVISAFGPSTLNVAFVGVTTLVLLASLVVVSGRWGRYEAPADTRSYQDVLPKLLNSSREFCVMLRPFGADGEVIVPFMEEANRRRWAGPIRSTVTLEQVVARAVSRTLGLETYAMVDQDRSKAPPGPSYLRAPHAKWQLAAGALIRRAHSIVIVLPPDQDLRAALDWELRRIVRLRRQSRVLIVLPPSTGRHRLAHVEARRQACVLVEALAGCGAVAEVDPAKVRQRLDVLPANTLALRLNAAHPGLGVETWHIDRRRPRIRIGSCTYEDGLSHFVRAVESSLAGLDHAARYPPPRSPAHR